MYCNQCGKPLAGDFRFCRHCGSAVANPNTTPSSTSSEDSNPSTDRKSSEDLRSRQQRPDQTRSEENPLTTMAARMISEVVAKWFTRLAAAFSVYVGVVTAAAAILGDPGFGNWYLIDVGLSFGLAYGVYRKSRISAILLFAYFVTNRVSMNSGFSVATVTYGVIFFLGVLGAFAHHAIARDRGKIQES